MTERVRLGIGDQRSHRAVGRDAEDRTRLVAADVEVAGASKARPSGRTPGGSATTSITPAAPSSAMAEANDAVRERLGDVEQSARQRDRDAPFAKSNTSAHQSSFRPRARSGRSPGRGPGSQAVGDVQASVGVERE
jgi:hypothetical protein